MSSEITRTRERERERWISIYGSLEMNEHSLPLCSPVAAPKSFPICNEKDEEGSEEEEEEE